ncbi:unnamed protein product [Rotaria sp. Silwood2]|nr:unnamed protein product [Rotaria sp. Silwood2]
MRRHTLEHDSIGQQIKSVFTSPTRKFLNFKNNSDDSNSILHSNRRTRRVSVPEKKYSDKLDNNAELDTIDENEANATAGSFDQTDIDRSQSSNKTNTDSTSKRTRLQAVISSRSSGNEKKTNLVVTDSVGGVSHTTNSTSGPGGGGAAAAAAAHNETNDGSNQRHVVASLAPYANTAVPTTSLRFSSGKSSLASPTPSSSSSSSSSSTKEHFSRRTRSHSKTDTQSVSDKSLFSRIFSKKSKKPLGTLITTTTKSIDLDINKKRQNLINQSSLAKDNPRSTIDEEEEFDDDDPNMSAGSLSDTDYLDEKDDVINTNLSSSTTLTGSRKNSSSGKKSTAAPNSMALPTSDSQYYASMSSAPTGFSISYHKYLTKGNDDLRRQAALGLLQQQNKKGAVSGANNLMVRHLLYI